MDWLDIDSRINHAVDRVDKMAAERIQQIDDMLDQKIEQIRELLNGIKVNVNLEAHQVLKPTISNPPPS